MSQIEFARLEADGQYKLDIDAARIAAGEGDRLAMIIVKSFEMGSEGTQAPAEIDIDDAPAGLNNQEACYYMMGWNSCCSSLRAPIRPLIHVLFIQGTPIAVSLQPFVLPTYGDKISLTQVQYGGQRG